MSTSNGALETLMRFYEAESKYLAAGGGDFSVMAETLDPDCVMFQADSLPYGGEWRGHAGYEAWVRAFGEQWASLEVTDPQVYEAAEELLFVRSTVRATAKKSGSYVEFQLLQQIQTRDGRILEIRPFYWDTASVVRALGA